MNNVFVYEGPCSLDGCVNHQRIHRFWAHYNREGKRWCGRDKHWVDQETFHHSSQWCKPCRSAYFQKNYDPKRAREKNFEYYYGHKIELYNHFFEQQNGLCAICQKPQPKRKQGRKRTESDYLSLDHDHVTGHPRGLLCQSCNFILGWMRDNPEALDRVHIYLVEKGELPEVS